MRIPRPHVPRPRLSPPWRWRLRRAGSAEAEEGIARPRNGHDEDVRLLRRTRLRLVAVSGAVTLLILIVLGFAVYTATSNVFTNDSVSRLKGFADDQVAAYANWLTGA